jgi:hypothetical protein
VVKQVPKESFFNFFAPLPIPDEDNDEEEEVCHTRRHPLLKAADTEQPIPSLDRGPL